jgi:hypothetical protein
MEAEYFDGEPSVDASGWLCPKCKSGHLWATGVWIPTSYPWYWHHCDRCMAVFALQGTKFHKQTVLIKQTRHSRATS